MANRSAVLYGKQSLADANLTSDDVTPPSDSPSRALGTDMANGQNYEKSYLALVNSIDGIVWESDANTFAFTFVSRKAEDILGYAVERWLEESDFWKNHIHPDDVEWAVNLCVTATAERKAHQFEYRMIAADGRVVWLRDIVTVIVEGERVLMRGVMVDITERKYLEERLRQAQKMEAVGRLAGGIAHDFNNLLTAINGYAELTLMKLSETDALRRNLEEIRKAGQRAAELTRQLLTLSRKQVIEPELVNLNAVVAQVETMLRRLLGDRILLQSRLDIRADAIRANPTHLEEILLNLVTNGRDAMAEGGTLTIATSRLTVNGDDPLYAYLPTGVYTRLTVSDTGTGMDEATSGRAFEPFFTTKGAGKGSGLGLSTVYGLVQQNSGHITIVSALGKGTVCELLFPAVASIPQTVESQTKSRETVAGKECILLVEDEEMVRRLTRELLEMAGYGVIEAANGKEALAICERAELPIHLVLTDVIMPGMTGAELASRLKSVCPDLRVMYMSGYTGDTLSQQGIAEDDIAFLQKPFTPDALAQKVKQVLEQ